MSINEVLCRNAAAVTLRFSSLADCTEKGTFELPIDFSDDKQLSSLVSKDTEFEVDYDVVEVNKLKDFYDISFDIRLKNSGFKHPAMSLVFKFHGFDYENFIMIPSHYYGTIKDLDSLNSLHNDQSYAKSKIMNLKDCLIPGMGFYNSANKSAFFIYFKDSSQTGNERMGFKKNPDSRVCEFFLDLSEENNEKFLNDGRIKINVRVVFAPCENIGEFYNVYFNSSEGLFKNIKLNNKVSMSHRAECVAESSELVDKQAQPGMLQSAVKTLQSILNGDREVLSNYSDELEKLIAKVLLKDISLVEEKAMNNTEVAYRIEDLETSYFISKSLLYLYHEDEGLIRKEWNSIFNEFGDRLMLFATHEVVPYVSKKLEGGFGNNVFCTSLGIFPAVLAYWGHYLKNKSMVSKAEEVAEMLYGVSFEYKAFCNGIFSIEWSYMLTESFVTLYEATGKKIWLDRGMDAVSFLSTFNNEFKQGVPDEFSGNAIFRLFLYTMDFRYIKLLRKILYFPRENSNIKLGLLTYLEVPGLYINPSECMIAAVDNIDAKVLDRRNEKLRIVITNYTDYPARIRTLADRNSNFNNKDYGFHMPPLGDIYLGPGDTRVLSF